MTGKKRADCKQDPHDMILEWAQACAKLREQRGQTCDSCPEFQRCQQAADKTINNMFHGAKTGRAKVQK